MLPDIIEDEEGRIQDDDDVHADVAPHVLDKRHPALEAVRAEARTRSKSPMDGLRVASHTSQPSHGGDANKPPPPLSAHPSDIDLLPVRHDLAVPSAPSSRSHSRSPVPGHPTPLAPSAADSRARAVSPAPGHFATTNITLSVDRPVSPRQPAQPEPDYDFADPAPAEDPAAEAHSAAPLPALRKPTIKLESHDAWQNTTV